ncbi:MAG: 2Fe-2S iron-sulfur cluster-binding protein, partial [Myxococcota bacterium]
MKIAIDGRTLEAQPGQTVLQVARENNIYIPSLCYHPRTGKAGRCRACLVELEGMNGLKESCALEVKDGMRVRTDTPAVLDARRMVVELHLSGGQHDCISCQANGNCELQNMAYSLGIEHPSFVVGGEKPESDDSSEGIIRDHGKCIQCGRCVT